MKRRHTKPRPTEDAKCAGCGNTFKRCANSSRKRQYCDRENCQKIRTIKNTVARFSDLPDPNTGSRTAYSEIRKYEGGYTE